MSKPNDQMFNALQSLVEGCELTLEDLKYAIIERRSEDATQHLMALISVLEGIAALIRKEKR